MINSAPDPARRRSMVWPLCRVRRGTGHSAAWSGRGVDRRLCREKAFADTSKMFADRGQFRLGFRDAGAGDGGCFDAVGFNGREVGVEGKREFGGGHLSSPVGVKRVATLVYATHGELPTIKCKT